MSIEAVDAVVNHPRWMPYWGWHDDHRERDRQPGYLPAIQQVRSEYAALIDVLVGHVAIGGRALQLGMGAQRASHEALRALFGYVLTIDEKGCVLNDDGFHGLDTHLASAQAIAGQHAPFDFLFIDAGHKLADVDRDYWDYRKFVREGGIIAVHDACKRPGYEDEIDVWRWLTSFKAGIWTLIGTEVGIAWTLKRS